MTGSGRDDVDEAMRSGPEPLDGGSRRGGGGGTAADDGVACAIEQMWPAASERFRQRVAVIEDYVAEVVLGKADSANVGDARDAAHKLAGTLGLFGLSDGSAHAKELDSGGHGR